MKIQHISDTHGYHHGINILDDVDVVVHTGDATNYRESYRNEVEFYDFINWYAQVLVQHKIYIAGNHDSYIFHNQRIARSEMEQRGIIYLDKEEVVINNIKFYGDPISPEFGDWKFMTDRNKMNNHWSCIPDDVNVLLTHTPPKGIMDLSEDRNGELHQCGCSALTKKLVHLQNLKLHCFGHIHDMSGIINTGMKIINNVRFSNAAAVTDRKFNEGITYNGTIIEL